MDLTTHKVVTGEEQALTDDEWLVLQHDWVVIAEHDGGYVLGRCAVCGLESLLDDAPAGMP